MTDKDKNNNNFEFVHLRLHSSFSLSEGAIKLDELLLLCQKHKMPAVAITDSNNLYASLEFSKEFSSKGVQPIIGCELLLLEEDLQLTKIKNFDKLIVLAKDCDGYRNLIKIVSDSCTRISKDPSYVTIDELIKYNQGLIVLTGGYQGTIGRLCIENKNDEAEKFLLKLKEVFKDRLYIEISRHNLIEEHKTEDFFVELAYKHEVPLVATNNVYFATKDMYEAHDALLCIAEGKYILDEERRKLNPEFYFKSSKEMKELFLDLPEAINNTLIIAQKCSVKAEERAPMLPKFTNDNKEADEAKLLKEYAKSGLNIRLENEVLQEISNQAQKDEITKQYQERLNFELDVIIKMNFPGYFLIVSDFIKYSKKNNIPVGPGRGSGAGSLVAWSLEITNLNPIKFGLLFERFLNPERISMPDFDIDFCQEKRDQVIEYVQKKYGKDQVAHIITFGKLQAKAVIRDVGRVMQIPYSKVDRISKLVPFNAVNPITLSKAIEMESELRKARDEDEQIAKLLNIALQLEGLHRHASTHAAGVVIAERRLDELVPICRDPKSQMLVVQYSMKYAEAAGLVKFDFLGLKTLTVIERTCNLIKEDDIEINIDKIKLDDDKTYQLLSSGSGTGVFQLESSGMKDTLRKMKPDKIEDIIALGALYRPGPMDNIPRYIACKHGLEQVDYLHPKLKNVLEETFGVIIYQEQVMEIAKILAGYTLGSADLLRRAMGKKIKSEMDDQRKIFVEGAINNGIDKKQAEDIFELVAKFAGYGFNKSHAAAYGLISYQTAYLKANYIVEFLVASINLEIDDTDKINIFCEEAKNFGIKILPPDINKSNAYFKIEKLDNCEKAIRYGLGAIKNVGFQAMLVLEENRAKNGIFKDVLDFATRFDSKSINKRQMENLIKAGAFDKINSNRAQMFESIEILNKFNVSSITQKNQNQFSLFKNDNQIKNPPKLAQVSDWDLDLKLEYEKDAIGFYLFDHPVDKYQNYLNKLEINDSKNIVQTISFGFSFVKLVGVVTSVKTKITVKGKFLIVSLSDKGGNYEISIFDEKIINSTKDILASKHVLYITAEARKEDSGVRFIANSIDLFNNIINKKFNHVTIWIKNINSIDQIKECCENNKNLTFNLVIKDQNKEIDIKIPYEYKISFYDLERLEKLNLVNKIEFKVKNK